MKETVDCKYYSIAEERLNVVSHGLGLVLSVFGLVFLLLKSFHYSVFILTVSFTVFGLSLIMLYAASTFYHYTREPNLRYKLKIFDHIAIFFLIAGTYTPFSLITLGGSTGWIIFGTAWSIAFFGTILKIYFTGRYKILSTLLYVAMGWVIIFAINPLLENLSSAGIYWLFAGGLSYTLGAVLYNFNRIKFNHAIFHIFVLLGSFCHFMAVYFHVIPSSSAA